MSPAAVIRAALVGSALLPSVSAQAGGRCSATIINGDTAGDPSRPLQLVPGCLKSACVSRCAISKHAMLPAVTRSCCFCRYRVPERQRGAVLETCVPARRTTKYTDRGMGYGRAQNGVPLRLGTDANDSYAGSSLHVVFCRSRVCRRQNVQT